MDPAVKEERKKILAMIVSIGGSPTPVVKSILEYKPEFVSFFASQDTSDQVMNIKAEVATGGDSIKSEMTIVDNVNDLLHCHGKAEEAVKRVLVRNYKNEEVIVDYTGGTKNMSVALSLAAIIHGFSFSYVGGEKRTKEGVGVVENGHEVIYSSVNPWDVLAVEERKKIMVLLNQYQFKAAKKLAEAILEKNTKQRSLYRALVFLIEGYYKWDLFKHQEARDSFRRARTDEWVQSDDAMMRSFARSTEKLQSFLKKIADTGKRASLELIMDLYANAERRFEEGKIDDAILRLYRLVEMIAQWRLLVLYGIDASNAAPDKIPEPLNAEFRKRYTAPSDGSIKLPQAAAFQVLLAFDDEAGKIFENQKKYFIDIQSARNNSYLAHGFSSSGENTYIKLRNFVLGLGIFNADDAPCFPKIAV